MAALDSLRVCGLQHKQQIYLKELSCIPISPKATFMSREPEPDSNLSRHELDSAIQPRQREDVESGGLQLTTNSSSMTFSCSLASDSRDNNATFSCSEETSPTKGKSLKKDSLSPGRLVRDKIFITTGDDCWGTQGNTEEVLKQHGGQKHRGPINKHHQGIHVQKDSSGLVSGPKTNEHLLFFPEASVKLNEASLNGNNRPLPSRLHCKPPRYSSVDHRHSDITYRFSISRLQDACDLHSDISGNLNQEHSDKEADESCRTGRSHGNLCVLPVSFRRPAQENVMSVTGYTIGNLISMMEPYRVARPRMNATKQVSPRSTERKDLDIKPDGGDDHDHGNANSSEEKEQEDKYDYDDDDESNEDDYDDFDEIFNMQTNLAELIKRNRRLRLSPAGFPYVNYSGNVGDGQHPRPLKRKTNLRRGPLTKSPSKRRGATSAPRADTEECEQRNSMDKWTGNEGRPMSEQMMKEYFRQLKQTICSNLVEEKFVDELVIRNVKSCSFYDQFSNVKLATNRQGSDGQSSDMPPIHHHCSAADG